MDKLLSWLQANIKQTTAKITALANSFKHLGTSINTTGKLTTSFKSQLSQATQAFSQWLSLGNGVNFLISKTKESIIELKNVNTVLTEISKTGNATEQQLKAIGDTAFDAASKYGAKVSDYLAGVQEMYHAGYKNAEKMAELSTLAQISGGLDPNLANDYLIASDAAYQYAGDTEKLNKLLDGQTQVTSKNAVSMEELAYATKEAASQLSNANISENELTALLGTGIATTRESGETVARAVKGIIMSLQQVQGETGFQMEVLDEDQLQKVEARCRSLGIELEYMQDGAARLRDPMEVLKELAEVYNSLPEDSAQKSGILSDIGGKYRSNVLSSILSNWDLYEKMLGDYENSGEAAFDGAMKSADSLEGSLNRLKNTWTDTVGNIADSDAMIAITNGFNGLLSMINKITAAFGSLGSIGLGAGLFAGLKNVG